MSLKVDLPTELIEHIFHFNALTSTQFCLTLTLTSSWTRHFAIPYLYQTIILKTLKAKNDLLNTFKSPSLIRPRPGFQSYELKSLVESIWLQPVSHRTLTIFQKCPNLKNLGLHMDNFTWLVHTSSPMQTRYNSLYLPNNTILNKPDLHVTLFSITSDAWHLSRLVPESDPTKISPVFAKITHLRVGGHFKNYTTYLNIAHFTKLTHLAIPYCSDGTAPLTDLEEFLGKRKLRNFVLVVYEDEVHESKRETIRSWVLRTRTLLGYNVNLLVSPSAKEETLQAEWEEEVRCGKSVWEKARRYTSEFIH